MRWRSNCFKLVIILMLLNTLSGCIIVGECIIRNYSDQSIQIKEFIQRSNKDVEMIEISYDIILSGETRSYTYNIALPTTLEGWVEGGKLFKRHLPQKAIKTEIEIKKDKQGGLTRTIHPAIGE